jgi:NAD-dependent deacetylase
MVEEVSSLILKSKSIAVLTGAGISVNAGIPDFRGEKGIYTLSKYDERVFDIDYFLRDSLLFYNFAREFYTLLAKAEPTFTHKFLAKLEENHEVFITTQNIDLLHRKANSKNIIYLHGSIAKSYCLNCGRLYPYEEMEKLIFENPVPKCKKCGGLIKPDVVFFSEPVKDFDKASEVVSKSDLFLALGTSLEVYPANLLVEYAKGYKVLVSKSKTSFDRYFDISVYEDLDTFFMEVSKFLGWREV